jgi:hypothetical protein
VPAPGWPNVYGLGPICAPGCESLKPGPKRVVNGNATSCRFDCSSSARSCDGKLHAVKLAAVRQRSMDTRECAGIRMAVGTGNLAARHGRELVVNCENIVGG